jgi:hypothetical protein
MYFNSPVIRVVVNKPTVDSIDIHSQVDWGWKLQGWKGEEIAAPDQWQDHFHAVIIQLAEFVDETCVWSNLDTGQQVSAWEAMMLLTDAHNDE